jgi:acetoin utilization deacetylase AcuC-like enzyme
MAWELTLWRIPCEVVHDDDYVLRHPYSRDRLRSFCRLIKRRYVCPHQVLFISLHQDSNYPPRMGYAHETGEGEGEDFNINVSLPPGTGGGGYIAAMDRVVVPALHAFK